MKKWIVNHSDNLSGEIQIEGAKNSLLSILPACILTKSIVHLSNVTPLKDTYIMIDILKRLNVRVLYDNCSKMIVDARNIKNTVLDDCKLKELRASYYFMGALIGMFKNVSVLGPGGCNFASRPIDLHLMAFDRLGYVNECNNNVYNFKKIRKNEKEIVFSKVSVGASVNAILASCRARGKVRLVNVALEPEIDDLIEFLNCCGADIKRENKDIVIKGVSKLHGCNYQIMEDRIEAGTYLIIGACIGNKLKIKYHESYRLKSFIETLKDMGVQINEEKDGLVVSKVNKIKDINLNFDVYPFLPTDLQQPLSILTSRCNRVCILKDEVYPSRYTQLEELGKMGFKMEVKEGCLYVYQSDCLKASQVECRDLRGGVSLVVASLIASGTSEIINTYYIERGYFNMINKLKKVGARIYEKD